MTSHRPLTIAMTGLLLVAFAPAAQAVHDGSLVLQVVNDYFDDIDMNEVTYEPGCGGGAFEIIDGGSGFRFHEVPESGETGAEQASFGGQESTGCGRAVYPFELPAGIDHFHVRFNATRTIEEFQVNSGVDAEQSLLIENADGVEQDRRAYYQPTDGSDEGSYIDPRPSFNIPNLQEGQVVWNFEDRGFGASQDVPNALSGVAFEGTVSNGEIEYSYIPADNSTVSEKSTQSSSDVVVEATIVSTLTQETVDRFDRINVRVQLQGIPELVHVVLPDGTIMEDVVTRIDNGPDGYHPDQLLVERFGGNTWFSVPYAIVAEQGAGDYTFVVQESQGLTVTPSLIPIAAIIVMLPFAASAFAIHGTLRFRREAFGGFQRAATGLIAATVALLVYYVAVMVSATVTGSIQRMIIRPFDAAAWLLYVQVALAAVGFIIVFVVGRELYKITVPRKEN